MYLDMQGIQILPVSELTMVLMKIDRRQADN